MEDIIDNGNFEELVVKLFRCGYPYKNMLQILKEKYDIVISLRTLHRSLRQLGLRRRNVQISSAEVIQYVENEIKPPGENRGYRLIYQHLIEKGIQIPQHTVRHTLKEVDPEGVFNRSRHRLKRRRYVNNGPNDVWHIDGNDKLKPFGFCIHGGIDGFSRKVLWLNVAETNKDPFYIAHYFINAVTDLDKLPKLVRSDRGTENVNVCHIQSYMRRLDNGPFGGENSFRYGKSVSNQRIEQWWSYLKRNTTQSWINFFKDLRYQGAYDDSQSIHVETLKFCFKALIQSDLDKVKSTWNHHLIRVSKNAESPGGRPNILYHFPNNYNVTDCGFQPDIEELEIVKSMYTEEPQTLPCQNDMIELARIIMEENSLNLPRNRTEAESLYHELIRHIEAL